MPRLCLMLCRLSLAAWFGAGCLFMAVVLGLRNSPLFGDEVRFNHPRVLFPLYYSLEFPLLIVATIASWVVVTTVAKTSSRRSLIAVAILSSLAFGLALVDFAVVYRPLAQMLESQVPTARFMSLHHTSRWINAAALVLTAISASWACWIDPTSVASQVSCENTGP
jgi:hypothetical protein